MLSGTLWTVISLATSTLVSEDLACMTAGLLIGTGALSPALGVAGCFIGIFAGDFGLWAAGRLFGRRVLDWPFVAKRIPRHYLKTTRIWLNGHLPGAILLSRFLPGTRVPLYLAAGVLGHRPWQFILWTFIAASIWTPLLVLASAVFGAPFVMAFDRTMGGVWLPVIAALLTLTVVWRLALSLTSKIGRAKLHAAVSRLWRWEFWPAWLFYSPVAVWIAILSIRYRGFTTVTAANPAIPDGGFVGESKHRILSSLPAGRVMPAELIPPGTPRERVAGLEAIMTAGGWSYPIILKPDAGERGAGVNLIRDAEEARIRLSNPDEPVLAQKYHPGPREAGIFYYRIPGEQRGRIFSITDKEFPMVTGDGRSTLADLIWSHPRYRMQARTFLARHAGRVDEVPASGERVGLCLSGNHVQGTMFLDGAHLLTPELETAIDDAARHVGGFFFGRFDIRYADAGRLKAGEEFAIIELNGVTSESTNIYDPSRSLFSAWATLCRQWSILFRIGHMNRRRGHRATPLPALIGRIVRHYLDRPAWGPTD